MLGILLFISAYFSGSETGMMSLNRYRLRHLEKQKHRGAKRVSKLQMVYWFFYGIYRNIFEMGKMIALSLYIDINKCPALINLSSCSDRYNKIHQKERNSED